MAMTLRVLVRNRIVLTNALLLSLLTPFLLHLTGGIHATLEQLLIAVEYGWLYISCTAALFPMFTGVYIGVLHFRQRFIFLEWTAPAPNILIVLGNAAAITFLTSILLCAQVGLLFLYLLWMGPMHGKALPYKARIRLTPEKADISALVQKKQEAAQALHHFPESALEQRKLLNEWKTQCTYLQNTVAPHKSLSWHFLNTDLIRPDQPLYLRLRLAASSDYMTDAAGVWHLSSKNDQTTKPLSVALRPDRNYEYPLLYQNSMYPPLVALFSNQSTSILIFDPDAGCSLYVDQGYGLTTNSLRALVLNAALGCCWCWIGLALGILFSRVTALTTSLSLLLISVLGPFIQQLSSDSEIISHYCINELQSAVLGSLQWLRPIPVAQYMLDGELIPDAQLWTHLATCGLLIPIFGLCIIGLVLRHREICSPTHYRSFSDA